MGTVWSRSWLMPGTPNCGRHIRQGRPKAPLRLLAKPELRDEGGVAIAFGLAKVIEQRPPLVDQHQQTAARMVVLRMGLEMLGEILDPLGEDRDLDFRGAGVALGATMFLDERVLALLRNRHVFSFDIALQVEPADDADLMVLCFYQSNRRFSVGREVLAIVNGDPDQDPPLTEQPCLIGGDG